MVVAQVNRTSLKQFTDVSLSVHVPLLVLIKRAANGSSHSVGRVCLLVVVVVLSALAERVVSGNQHLVARVYLSFVVVPLLLFVVLLITLLFVSLPVFVRRVCGNGLGAGAEYLKLRTPAHRTMRLMWMTWSLLMLHLHR